MINQHILWGGSVLYGLNVSKVKDGYMDTVSLPSWLQLSTTLSEYGQIIDTKIDPTRRSKPRRHSYGKTTLKTYLRAVQSILGGNRGH